MHDQEGRILDANSAACRQLGYSREELLGMTTSQIDVAEFAAGFKERLRRQLAAGTLICEGLHRTKNGRIIPVEVTSSTIQFDHQVAVLAILRDITERKALERTRREFAAAQMRNAQGMELKNRAISESEARYRRLAEGSLDAIVVADGEGRINLFNPAAEKIFGYEARQVLDQPLERLIPEIFPTEREMGASYDDRQDPAVASTRSEAASDQAPALPDRGQDGGAHRPQARRHRVSTGALPQCRGDERPAAVHRLDTRSDRAPAHARDAGSYG